MLLQALFTCSFLSQCRALWVYWSGLFFNFRMAENIANPIPGSSLGVEDIATPSQEGESSDQMASNNVGLSQDPRDQVEIVKTLCSHMNQLMGNLNPAAVAGMPAEARQVVQDMKSKMVMFVSGGDGQDGTGHSKGGPVKRSVSRIASSSVNSTTDTELNSSASENVPGKSERIKKEVKSEPVREGDLYLLNQRLVQALERLDVRVSPEMEPYDKNSGQSLTDYLNDFEEYCANRFKGRDSAWIGELGRHLKGEIHQAFLAHRAYGDSYGDLKKKLLKWHRESKEKREVDCKAAFSKASMQQGESVRLYAPRLENLFRQAYPHKDVETSYTLRDRFLGSIPRRYRKQVKSVLALTKTMGTGSMKWSQIVTWVGNYEETVTSEESEGQVAERGIWTIVDRQDSAGRTGGDDHLQQTSFFGSKQQVSTPRRRFLPRSFPRSRSIGAMPRASGCRGSRETNANSGWNFQLTASDRDLAARCDFCGILGHSRANCRRRLGLCLVCGDRGHKVKDCSKWRRNYQSSMTRSYSEGSNSRMYRPPHRQVRFDTGPPSQVSQQPGDNQITLN